jgi:mannose-6-phosphate isomerase-like protein (cupin superfamily)
MCFRTISTETAEHYTWGGTCDGWFLLKGETVHVIQERMPPGAAEVMHCHRKSRQLFYVLRGTLTMANATSSARVPAGQVVVIEPNVQHRATNESAEDAEFLVISCPPSHGDRFNCE